MLDTLIQHVCVVDGSGRPRYDADVGIVEDRIVVIQAKSDVQSDGARQANRPEQAKQVIDGNGWVLAPGFIDVHTHDDTHVIRFPACTPKISQGVTTVIVGNCGISASPAVLAASPPDPMNLLGEQDDFVYPAFSDYVDAVERTTPAVNVAALVGHTTLRNNVMDDMYCAASVEEVAAMKQALSVALSQGALGLSSGLAYASAKEAPTAEVMALVEELAAYKGIYTTHLRTEFEGILDAMEEAFQTGKHGNVPVVVSHLKCAGAKNWGRTHDVLAFMERTSATQDVSCDCYPYSASSSTLDLAQVTDAFEIKITWSERMPEHANKRLSDIAAELGVSLHDAARALQPAGAVYHCMDEADVERVLQHRLTAIGSDGLPNDPHPHPRLWGAFPKVLGHYCRERELFSLEEAVHKMTGMSAARFNLRDRGILREGAYADLVLFDPDTVDAAATFDSPIQVAKGIKQVWVNGQASWCEPNTAVTQNITRAGRFLKRGCV
ncbi:N-acyl-D-amino-acid deacylase family protein [Enterovibrio norvegicus]|uniref:N-acyl-D-amino-acid deacylase family protein n=1 Tax=Enterovibrio norvegicus TaxID=188144 RepID=UPI0013D5101B|nr:D-aminoacylase [Enterovibrio norvegicus]